MREANRISLECEGGPVLEEEDGDPEILTTYSFTTFRDAGMNCSGENFLPEIPGGVYFHLVHGVVDVVIVAVIVACNSLVTLAIVNYNRRRKTKGISSPLNSSSIRLVLSLAVSDILAGLTTIYYLSFDYSCAVYATLGAQQIPCVTRFAIFMFAASTSCYLIVALTIDRYVAIAHPLRHRDIMTKRVANRLILLMWLLGALIGFSLFFWNDWTPTTPCQEFRIVPIYYVTTLCTSNFVVAGTILLVLHWSIHREALASNELVRDMCMGNLQPSTGNTMNAKSARNVYLVLVVLFVLWTPLTVIVILRGQGVESPYLDLAYRLSLSVYSLGYFMNSFIYSWKNTTIKNMVIQLLHQLELRRGSGSSFRTIEVKDSCYDSNCLVDVSSL